MIELLAEQNSLLKRVCHVFESYGAIPIDVRSGSIIFELQITSRSRLKRFWSAYQDGRLQSELEELLLTKDVTEKVGCGLSLRLHVHEREYHRGLEMFGKQGISAYPLV